MTATHAGALLIPHVIWGKVQRDPGPLYASGDAAFSTPPIDVDTLARPRSVPGPAFGVGIDDVIDLLDATGRRLEDPGNPHVAEAIEMMAPTARVSDRVLRNVFRGLGAYFSRPSLEGVIAQDVGRAALDGWVPVSRAGQPGARVHAHPPRLVHVMAGNSPSTAALSITRGALSKGINVLKMASNDLFSATAILRSMADVDPTHPTVRSFAAVYWRGGDPAIEDLIFRPQYFDKLVVWGGESAVRNALKYAGPGFQIVQYDPKLSISMIGREAFDDHVTLRQVAVAAVLDSTSMNQDTCGASRYHFVEGSIEEADRYCGVLVEELGADRPYADAVGPATPADITRATDSLAGLEPLYRVWGDYSGAGLVIRSEEPVDFHPCAKTVNVVRVPDLSDALEHVTVATQTVGMYPSLLKDKFRDRLAGLGVQRVVSLGSARAVVAGLPHDGHLPLQSLVHWVSDEGD